MLRVSKVRGISSKADIDDTRPCTRAPLSSTRMTRQIRIKLTGASWKPSGWRWRAVDTAELKGFIPTVLVPHGARVDDVLTVELSSRGSGSKVTRVISPTAKQLTRDGSETGYDEAKLPRKKRHRKSRSSAKKANAAALKRIRALASQGQIDEAIALCEVRGWDPEKIDTRLMNSAESLSSAKLELDPGIVWGEASSDPLSFFSASLSTDVVKVELNPEHPAYRVLSSISSAKQGAVSELNAEMFLKLMLEAWATLETESPGSDFAQHSAQFRIELGIRLRAALEGSS